MLLEWGHVINNCRFFRQFHQRLHSESPAETFQAVRCIKERRTESIRLKMTALRRRRGFSVLMEGGERKGLLCRSELQLRTMCPIWYDLRCCSLNFGNDLCEKCVIVSWQVFLIPFALFIFPYNSTFPKKPHGVVRSSMIKPYTEMNCIFKRHGFFNFTIWRELFYSPENIQNSTLWTCTTFWVLYSSLPTIILKISVSGLIWSICHACFFSLENCIYAVGNPI